MTGIGLEIHFLATSAGQIDNDNIANCDQYRVLQVRKSTKEPLFTIDIPETFNNPFYDNEPLEHGYGTHLTPVDTTDKPWQGRPQRISTVAIYDTPFASDDYKTEGQDIEMLFETCVVCQRQQQPDHLLSCGRWGYSRIYVNKTSHWSAATFIPPQCLNSPSEEFKDTLNNSQNLQYGYQEQWY